MINQLREQIKENLIEMDKILDLLPCYSEGAELNKLYHLFDKLHHETKELNEKVNKLVNHLN